jgi:hypothetical protein
MAYEEVSQIRVDRARWEPPKARIVDTALEEDKMLVQGLCNNSIQEAFIEPAATLVIGSIMEVAGSGEYDKLMATYDTVYKEELAKLAGETDRVKREKIAASRAWLRLVNEAKKTFAKFTRAQGNEVVLAVLREKQHDKHGNETILVDAQDASDPFAARKKTLVLARIIARRITEENLDVTIVIVGAKGKGKSWFALALAEAIARELSIIKYGDESHWHEFWNYKEDTAIIDDDDILRLLKKETPKNHIKVLDDVGYSEGIDSRKWKSRANDEATSTVSINRTENGVTIYTSQSHFFIDKKIRLLLTFYIEIIGPKDDATGVNMAQLHEMTLHPRDDDDPIHYPFVYRIWYDEATGSLHTIVSPVLAGGCPSPEVWQWYEPERARRAADAIERKRQSDTQNAGSDQPSSTGVTNVAMKPPTTDELVAAQLTAKPAATALEIGDAIGKSERSVRYSKAWRQRRRQNNNESIMAGSTNVDT